MKDTTSAASISLPPLPTGGWSRAGFLVRLDEIERRKNNPEDIAYVRRLAEGAEEARRRINDEERRRLDADLTPT